ncbi:MAG: protein-disulfide reductase DsbD domain-containing protein, partial [Sphingosinicella sp.]
MRGLALLLSLLALLLAPSPAAAQHMRVELVAETAAVAAGGATTLAIVMRPERGWHGYWLNPGEAGAAPRHAWQLPSGWQAGPLRFPVPERMVLIGLVNHVYRGEHALLAELRAPPGAAPGARVPVRLRVDYLVCSDEICVPERAELDLVLGVGPAGARDPAFDRYRAALPRPLAAPGRFASAGGRLRFAIPLPQGTELDRPHLFVAQEDAVAYSAHQAFSRSGDWLVVEIAAGRRAAALDRLNAVLRTGEGIGFALALQPGPVPPAGIPLAPARAPLSAASFLLALLGALAGGLVLNLMPCVFPILSLKALSLARAGESDTQSRSEAIAYTAGALLCCLALGALLLVLRAGGAALGWAFQLQDPRVILLLLLLVTAIALNLAGLYRLPMLTG